MHFTFAHERLISRQNGVKSFTSKTELKLSKSAKTESNRQITESKLKI